MNPEIIALYVQDALRNAAKLPGTPPMLKCIRVKADTSMGIPLFWFSWETNLTYSDACFYEFNGDEKEMARHIARHVVDKLNEMFSTVRAD